MGSIVQKQPSTPLVNLSSLAFQPFSLSQCSKTKVLSNGMTKVTMQDGTTGLYYHKLLTQTNQIEENKKWLQKTYRYSCNVLHFQTKTLSMFCSAHTTITAVIEYGTYSLAQALQEKDSNALMILDKSETAATERTMNTSVQMLQLIKCLIEATEEHFESRNEWITFHTSTLIYFEKISAFKYLFIPQFDGVLQREIFFDPYQNCCPGAKQAQSTTVFSIGMILMSLLLKQDASSCYNFQNLSFCWSIFQQNKEKINDFIMERASNGIYYSRISPPFEEDLCALTLAALAPTEHRTTFVEIKKIYFRMLRKIGTNGSLSFAEKMKPQDTNRRSRQKEYQHICSDLSNKQNDNKANLHQKWQEQSSSFSFLAGRSPRRLLKQQEQKVLKLKVPRRIPNRELELKRAKQVNLA